jgi:outer membrane protein assembly factor BamB
MGALELVAITHQHRIEATREGKAEWSFLADGRISAPPVVIGELAVFGAHDGCVYAIGSDGRLRWKYLLAPCERMIGVNAQLESSWPVYGAAAMDGHVIASAGTHVELGGGVTVLALDPASGRVRWVKRLQKHPSEIPVGGKGANIVAYSFINSVPRIEGGEVVLGDGGRRGGEFRFAPDESEAALNARLNSPPRKK